MDETARLSLRGSGPDWTSFAVHVDGKVLPVLRLSLENTRQATLVLEEFDVDVVDVPARLA